MIDSSLLLPLFYARGPAKASEDPGAGFSAAFWILTTAG
jgi:hypothetical protein